MKRINICLIFLTVLTSLFTSCDGDVFDLGKDPAEGTSFKTYDGSPISNVLEADGRFSEYVEVLKTAGLYNALNQASSGVSFTAFAPTNDAMNEFAERTGSRVIDQSVDFMRDFVLYHTVKDSILPENFINKTSLSNLTSDIIYITVDTDNAGEVILTNSNSDGRVIEMGISASNGKIYVLSKALTPLVETVYDRIVEDPEYGIMLDAVKATGWDKKLRTLSDTVVVEGQLVVTSHNYTVLGVSDETFSKAGINSLAELKTKLQQENTEEGITVDSLLSAYVGYHIVNSKVNIDALGAIQGASLIHMWSTGADNLVFTVANDTTKSSIAEKYLINAEGVSAKFVEEKSNVLALNGFLHQVDSWMPVWEPKQQIVVWDFADDNEIRSMVTEAGVEYQPSEAPKKQEKVRLTTAKLFANCVENDHANSTFDAVDYYTVTMPSTIALNGGAKAANNNDCVVFNLGNAGSATLTTPTLVRGKYRVTLDVVYTTSHSFMRTKSEGTGGTLEITFDGGNKKYVAPYTQVKSSAATVLNGTYTATIYDEIEFDETSAHEFKFIIKDGSASTNKNFSLQFDTMTFTPIE